MKATGKRQIVEFGAKAYNTISPKHRVLSVSFFLLFY